MHQMSMAGPLEQIEAKRGQHSLSTHLACTLDRGLLGDELFLLP